MKVEIKMNKKDIFPEGIPNRNFNKGIKKEF